MHPLPNFSTHPIVAVRVVCYHAWVESLALSPLLQVSIHQPSVKLSIKLIVSPGAHYVVSNSAGVLWLGAGGIWLSAFVMVFLPVEMRKRQMF
jgi:hypothetical protein